MRLEKERKCRISACIIMKDAAEDIGECLESLQGSVDEFVVVDTGSADNSKEIAARYAGKVYDFPWRENFAAAKNYALDQATGDWIIFLDSDESLSEETRKNLRSILSTEGVEEKVDMMQVYRRNVCSDSRKQAYEDDYSERIFRRDPALRYHDPIHEYLKFDDGRKMRMLRLSPKKLTIWHKGYSPERMSGKIERNIRMLEEIRDKGGDKPYLYYYLADHYRLQERYGEMAEAAEASIRREEAPNGDSFIPYQLLYEAREHLGAEDLLLEVLEGGMEKFPLRPDFFLFYGRRLKEQGSFREALTPLRKAEKNFQDFPRNSPGRKCNVTLAEIYGELAEVCEKLGNTGKAKSYRRKAAKI